MIFKHFPQIVDLLVKPISENLFFFIHTLQQNQTVLIVFLNSSDILLQMGQTCSFPVMNSKDIYVPQLKERNSYGYTQDSPDDTLVRSIFAQSYDENRRSKVISIIENTRQKLFTDQKFMLNEKESLRLSVLFNFRTNRTRTYSTKQQTDITSFIQLHIEFSYLTSVFYFLSRREAKAKILPKLIQTQQTNAYGAYSTTLYCNGEKHQVIIDDRMPTHNDNFVYLRIVKGIQLWPLILEKSWCKQIDSYEAAKGLSPQDAFQEITGIPAYTYTIKGSNRPTIKKLIGSAIAKGYWVTLIARTGLTDLCNKQVFYLESINQDDYTLISPFVSYNFQNYPAKRRGEVVVKQDDIFSHFEHVVIGFYKENYVPLSYPISSQARQELIFQLNVKNREEVSIRFNQFYNGYLAAKDKEHYQYSPVMIQLYEVNVIDGVKKSCKLVNYCQGCTRSLSGARSTHCSVNILEPLQGKYILRLQIGWNLQQIMNKGNLVIYSTQGNVQINRLSNTQILFKEIYPSVFERDGKNLIILHEHSLQVNTFDKQKSTLIMFHNVTNSVHHFQADFSQSKNILLRGREVKNKYAYLRLQPEQKEIIQILPLNMKQNIEIHNFQMNKIPIQL